MARNLTLLAALSLVLGISVPGVDTAVRATAVPERVASEELWHEPGDIAAKDLFNGPWGQAFAPDPVAPYRFRRSKRGGANPGMIVVDSLNREWSVKQEAHGRTAEGPIEVVLSRVLSAVGYRQPPVYFLPAFSLVDTFGPRHEPGGRFRLNHPELKERGAWDWQSNPFVGTTPYSGLLVILIMFNSSDLKNSNNSVFDHTMADGAVERWYVVRDLGSALGSTSRIRPMRGDADQFALLPFLAGSDGRYVRFGYTGWHERLVRDRIMPDDVRWASGLLGRLTDAQWRDAFRAGGYDAAAARPFIQRLREKIAEGLAITG
ncbi:MAG TPA: hypothetical protein VFO21_17330 [Vicinamibacterales bacterium]|nr:hypothetical protein [Vicinamibacterales bacterium]